LWNRYHQWLPAIVLMHRSAIFSFYSLLTYVSLLENESEFEIVTQLADTGKRPPKQLIVCGDHSDASR
jgi:hypothetical protein